MSGILPYILALLALILYALRWVVNMASQRGSNRNELDPDVLDAYLEKLKSPDLDFKERSQIEEKLKKHEKAKKTRQSRHNKEVKKPKKTKK
jgi:hypothetical protein